MQQQYPEIQWTEIRQYDQLRAFDSLLACESAQVLIRANQPFGLGISWKSEEKGVVGMLPAGTLVAMTVPKPTSEELRATVIDLHGRAFFTHDPRLIQKYALGIVRTADPTRERAKLQVMADLTALAWEAATENRLLGPLDMLWTGIGGRIELEILREGPQRLDNDAIAVRGSDGRATGAMRLPRQTYFIVDPQYFAALKIRKVLGDVLIARNRSQVESFLQTYGTYYSSFGRWTREEVLDWIESLGRDEMK